MLLYLMFSTVSSGMGATVCTAGRFLLVAPLTKLDAVVVEGAASVAPGGGGQGKSGSLVVKKVKLNLKHYI